MTRLVAYIRVSTAQQQASGLGLDAQRATIRQYAETNGATIVSEHVEIESGKKDDRPALEKALREGRLTDSRVCIARLDRLSRNAAFLLTLQESGADFVCCDNPHATPLTIGVLALVAAEEARSISIRTKAALKAAKARGQRLGNPNGAKALRRAGKGNTAAQAARVARADARAHDLADTITDLQAQGITTVRGIAHELNKRGYRSPRGGEWHGSSVSNLLKRLAI
ncbi:recombinase family protein [Pseudooceanicola atlanticus]|uniref:recombinase family protein n=1 Tax=Pseudooceanicola atlanticus TaxID=1461694 RepID=UPI002355AB2A|nr:recombinase family protein [Pseudooceanicola atlanticus]